MPAAMFFMGCRLLQRVQNKRIPADEAGTLYPLLVLSYRCKDSYKIRTYKLFPKKTTLRQESAHYISNRSLDFYSNESFLAENRGVGVLRMRDTCRMCLQFHHHLLLEKE